MLVNKRSASGFSSLGIAFPRKMLVAVEHESIPITLIAFCEEGSKIVEDLPCCHRGWFWSCRTRKEYLPAQQLNNFLSQKYVDGFG